MSLTDWWADELQASRDMLKKVKLRLVQYRRLTKRQRGGEEVEMLKIFLLSIWGIFCFPSSYSVTQSISNTEYQDVCLCMSVRVCVYV